MRLKTDENLPLSVVTLLRDAPHEVHTALEEQLGGSEDERLLDTAARESRTVITLDKDLADIRAYPPAKYSGIIVLRPREHTTAGNQTLVTRLLPLLSSHDLTGKLWVVDERRVRSR